MMNWEQRLKQAPLGAPASEVAAAIWMLFDRDSYLLQNDASERAVSHRLAVYLERFFPAWHVDCEYNRDGADPKMVSLPWSPPPVGEDDEWSGRRGNLVLPDIIVHRRGTRENLLVIEMKKSTNPDRRHERDTAKLRAYQNRNGLAYRYGLFLCFSTEGEPDVLPDWVSTGA